MTAGLESNKDILEQAAAILAAGSQVDIRNWVHSLYPAETAYLLESLETEDRAKIWAVIPPNVMGEILVKVNVGVGFNAPPMTFTVNGRQYLAIASGLWRNAKNKLARAPEMKHFANQTMVFVFGL